MTQELFWVDTLDDAIDDDSRSALSASARALIQLYYTPASRDAARQIRATTVRWLRVYPGNRMV